ncbi:hypothetical protein MSKU9_0351 [Komagataeibacter diospyri]|uniref:Uncharacterized protein n=1 Tax=Komagataeibacter diospyri TaxID=1932662 RepID=A0A4P5NKG7_9PROT|nr:hypothetical protein MSKU9_0351 [Komagataeibacter diospyri]
MASHARRLIASTIAGFAGLLTFASPAEHHPVPTANEISARSWGRVGSSLRRAMKDADARTSSPAKSLNPDA